MLADAVLIAHHEVLRGLLREMEHTAASDPGERRRILNSLVNELLIHTQIEEHIFYPAVRKITGLVDIAFAEHRHLDDQLAVLLRTDPASERFGEEFEGLKSGVEQHAGEEERDMFPECRALPSAELEDLGARMQALQERLRSSKVAQSRIALQRELLRHVPFQ